MLLSAVNSGSGVALAARRGSTMDWLVYRKVRRSIQIRSSRLLEYKNFYNWADDMINSIPDYKLALARHPQIGLRKS